MRRGCIIATAISALVLLIGGYFGYKYFKNLVDIPDDLRPYKERASLLAMIKSQAPPPAKGSLLTTEQLDLYLKVIDSVGGKFAAFRAEFDSMGLTHPNDESASNLLKGALMLRPLLLYTLSTRRGIVNVLNRHNFSLDEYDWIRRRVIAAARISNREFDSVLTIVIPPNTFLSGLRDGLDDDKDFPFFSIDSAASMSGEGTLYGQDAVDSAEILLVHPYHDRILSRGFASLLGVERLMRTTMKEGNVRVNVREKPKGE